LRGVASDRAMSRKQSRKPWRSSQSELCAGVIAIQAACDANVSNANGRVAQRF
jgi:hypothetical protein